MHIMRSHAYDIMDLCHLTEALLPKRCHLQHINALMHSYTYFDCVHPNICPSQPSMLSLAVSLRLRVSTLVYLSNLPTRLPPSLSTPEFCPCVASI